MIKNRFCNLLILSASIILFGGCASYSPVDVSGVVTSLENSKYVAVQVYPPGFEPQGEYETLGQVDSYICNRSGSVPATPEAAAGIIREKARRAGANAVIQYQCDRSGTSFNENCWSSIRCSGYAIRHNQRNTPQHGDNSPKSGEYGLGTCFAVSSDGFIVTNNHVVDGVNTIHVRLSDGSVHQAKVLTNAESTDIAILKIEAAGLSFLPLGSSRDVNLGEEVFTIGYPLADILGNEPKYTEGVVSSKSGLRNEAITYQITVPVQPGNSGGALVNQRGQAIGVITSTASSITFFKESGNLPQNINWAVKADYIKPLLEFNPENSTVKSRQDAINKTKNATCMVYTSSE